MLVKKVVLAESDGRQVRWDDEEKEDRVQRVLCLPRSCGLGQGEGVSEKSLRLFTQFIVFARISAKKSNER